MSLGRDSLNVAEHNILTVSSFTVCASLRRCTSFYPFYNATFDCVSTGMGNCWVDKGVG